MIKENPALSQDFLFAYSFYNELMVLKVSAHIEAPFSNPTLEEIHSDSIR